jgi:uncharacterized protein (TIGR03435 family)
LIAANGGAMLQHKEGTCITESDGAAPAGLGSTPAPYCGSSRTGRDGGDRTIDGVKITMPDLVRALATAMGREVLDRTGVSGTFDVHLRWTADVVAPGTSLPGGAPGDGLATFPDPHDVSLFTALREQLGLRLQAVKAPLGVLIIDSVEPPDPD